MSRSDSWGHDADEHRRAKYVQPVQRARTIVRVGRLAYHIRTTRSARDRGRVKGRPESTLPRLLTLLISFLTVTNYATSSAVTLVIALISSCLHRGPFHSMRRVDSSSVTSTPIDASRFVMGSRSARRP